MATITLVGLKLKTSSVVTSNDMIHIRLKWQAISGLILGLYPANERRRYEVTPSLIGRAQT